MDPAKAQRLKELEEKKKRLSEMKKARGPGPAAPDSPGSVRPDSSSAAAAAGGATGDAQLDDLLRSLLLPPPPSSSTATTAADPQQQLLPHSHSQSAPRAGASRGQQPSSPASRRSAQQQQLTLASNVVVIDIAPTPPPATYDKRTQTDGDDDDDDGQQHAAAAAGTDADSDTADAAAQSAAIGGGSNEQQQQAADNNGGAEIGLSLLPGPEENAAGGHLQDAAAAAATPPPPPASLLLTSAPFLNFLERSSRVVERALTLAETYGDVTVDYASSSSLSDSAVDSDGYRSSQLGGRASGELLLKASLFDDRWSRNRSITDVAWSPKYSELVLASYSGNETSGGQDPDGVVLVWSLHNLLGRPEMRFHAQSPVMRAFFSEFSANHSNNTLVVGACYSGQLVLWDSRAGHDPVQKSKVEHPAGHTHPVYCAKLVGTSNAYNLVSLSTDGHLCSWLLDSLVAPAETLDLQAKQAKMASSGGSGAAGTPIAATAFDFVPGEVSGFFVGSEEGVCYTAFRHGSKSGVFERFDGHTGPVTGLSVHASDGPIDFSHLFLTCSTDWSVKLWTKNHGRPLLSFEDASDYVYDVQWCPAAPATFATVDGSGVLAVWDLNQDLESPVAKVPASTRALNRLRWSPDGRRVLVGGSDGTIRVYEWKTATQHADREEYEKFARVIGSVTPEDEVVPV